MICWLKQTHLCPFIKKTKASRLKGLQHWQHRPQRPYLGNSTRCWCWLHCGVLKQDWWTISSASVDPACIALRMYPVQYLSWMFLAQNRFPIIAVSFHHQAILFFTHKDEGKGNSIHTLECVCFVVLLIVLIACRSVRCTCECWVGEIISFFPTLYVEKKLEKNQYMFISAQLYMHVHMLVGYLSCICHLLPFAIYCCFTILMVINYHTICRNLIYDVIGPAFTVAARQLLPARMRAFLEPTWLIKISASNNFQSK